MIVRVRRDYNAKLQDIGKPLMGSLDTISLSSHSLSVTENLQTYISRSALSQKEKGKIMMTVYWDCTMGMHRARHFPCLCTPPHNSSAQQVGNQKLNNLLKVTQLICGQGGIRIHVSLTPKAQGFFTTPPCFSEAPGSALPSSSVFS